MSKGYQKYKNMTDKELEETYVDMKKELMKLRSQVATKTVPEKPARIKEIRRNIARILTLKKEKEAKSKA